MNEFKELEYKYKADDVGLKQFQELMTNIGYDKNVSVSSWDTYYTKNDSDFIRFRESPYKPEFTMKRKTSDNHNWYREEVDLPLDPKRLTSNIVKKFAKLLGYEQNFKIYKSCFIYWNKYVNFSYYIVYDEQMIELARFIEVECNKSEVKNVEESVEILKSYEKSLSNIDITPKNRLKRSLFEMFYRE